MSASIDKKAAKNAAQGETPKALKRRIRALEQQLATARKERDTSKARLKKLEPSKNRVSGDLAPFNGADGDSLQLVKGFVQYFPSIIYMKNSKSCYTYVNQAFEHHYGLKHGEAIGKTTNQILGRRLGAIAKGNDQIVLERGDIVHSSQSSKRPDGTDCHLEVTKFPIRGSDGAVTGLGGINIDRSAELNATRAMENSNEKLEDYAMSASDWFWEQDADLRMVRITGANTPETLQDPKIYKGKTRWEAAGGDPETDEMWRQHRDDLLARRPFRDFRFAIQLPNGETQHLTVSGRPTFDPKGDFLGYRGSASNITEQVVAEERAREAHQLLQDAIEAIPTSVMMFDNKDELVLCNSKSKQILDWQNDLLKPGTTFEALVRNTIKKKMHVHDVDAEAYLNRRLEQHFTDGQPIEVERRDGRWVLVQSSAISSGGRIEIRTDITDQKRAQQALMESEQRIGDAVESIREGFALYDAEDRLVHFNATYKRLHPGARNIIKQGMKFEEMLRVSVAKGGIPAAKGREEAFIADRLERHRNPQGSIERKLGDGITYLINERRTGDGGWAITLNDITELRTAQLEAEAAHKRLLDAFEALPASFMLFDQNEKLVLFNGKTKEMLPWHRDLLAPGVSVEQLVRNSSKSNTTRHSFSRKSEWIENRLEAFRNPGVPTEFHRQDGSTVIAMGQKTASGETVQFLFDITNLKHAEQRADTAEVRLADAVEFLPVGFALFDQDEKLVHANQKMIAMRHWQSELWQKPGIKYREIIENSMSTNEHAVRETVVSTKSQRQKALKMRMERFRAGSSAWELMRSDGTWVLNSARSTSDGGRVLIRVDITE